MNDTTARDTTTWWIAVALIWMIIAGGPASGDDPPAEPPALSLETLFHPDQKYDYDGKLATAHWIADKAPLLIVRRADTWMQVDLRNGQESVWPLQQQLQRQLSQLDGVDDDQATKSAAEITGKLKRSDETVLVKIDNSLAIVSASTPARWLTRDAAAWQNATLDPAARRVAYTQEGDLFILDLDTGRTLRLTQDATDTLLDGILDWTYQEEIFGRGNYRGFWFSPDGNWLAMLRTDISGIEPYTITDVATDRGEGVVRRYSKAGDPIPHAELFLWDLRMIATAGVPPPRSIAKSTPQQQRIISGVWWHEHKMKLMFCLSDRKQTWRELHYLSELQLLGGADKSSVLLREESPAWIEPPTAPGFINDGSIVWLSSLPTGRSRLYWLRADGVVKTQLTPENFDVKEFHVRADGSLAIVTGDLEHGTVGNQAYRIDLSQAAVRIPDLLPITQQTGWHQVDISPDGLSIVDQFSALMQPPTLSVRPTIDGTFAPRELDKTELSVKGQLIEPQLFRIETDDKALLPAILFQPPGASEQAKAPVIIETYGGPQTPVVRNRWSGTRTLYRQLLARSGIAVLVVDNRSSAGRGIADSWAIKGRVGEVEFKDLISAVDWLKSQPWVDGERIAVRGWSFGGFMTLYAMTHSDAFTAGIAGGSVSDWREYDSFYTERYMGLPSENPAGYDATAPVKSADRMHGHVLLIHGEVDDNVHPSGTLRMAAALQQAGKDFEMMIYPGSAHAIHNQRQVWHLSRLTHRFLLRQLLPGSANGPAGTIATQSATTEQAKTAKTP